MVEGLESNEQCQCGEEVPPSVPEHSAAESTGNSMYKLVHTMTWKQHTTTREYSNLLPHIGSTTTTYVAIHLASSSSFMRTSTRISACARHRWPMFAGQHNQPK
ncbi:hypothetical protein V1478_013849 [Vespula squamosa]|uniref:Uncharacterized protein n=1 Tax=Vespula squamosa TaxID=30214 RepID=A0ABD2A6B0_VESSQ